MDSDVVKKLVDIPKNEVEETSKAVSIAKNEEAKAMAFYESNAKKTSDAEIKKAFEFLVREEAEHFNALTGVEEALKSQKKFAVVKDDVLRHLEKPKVYPERGAKGDLEENSELAVLLWAMRAETKAKNFYLAQAEKTKVKEIKKFWLTLAEFEAEHFDYLDGLFSSWTDTSDYIMG